MDKMETPLYRNETNTSCSYLEVESFTANNLSPQNPQRLHGVINSLSDFSAPGGTDWGYLVVFSLWCVWTGVLEAFIHILGTLVRAAGSLCPAGSLVLPL